jgi:hypothetical protein
LLTRAPGAVPARLLFFQTAKTCRAGAYIGRVDGRFRDEALRADTNERVVR